MMMTMPRPRPPNLQMRRSRHGKTCWYVRIGRGPLVRIRGEFGSTEFMTAYDAAVRGERPAAKPNKSKVGTLAWLIERYREVEAWTSLSLATRRQRENIFLQVIKTAGREPYTAITTKTIASGRDRRSSTPYQARHFLDTMRGLFSWAMDVGLVETNPTVGVKRPAKPKGSGFPVWTEEDLAAYERRWPLGTKERVWFAILVYTGLRRGDAVSLGRQHARNGIACIRTEKTGTEVYIRLLPPLLQAIEAGPTGDLAYICGERGGKLTKESFGNLFSDACRAAGVSKSAHGIRKAAATRAAENGATVAELEAMFGWKGGRMASLYTESANRKRLALEAAEKLLGENLERTSMLPPAKKVVASELK